LQTETAADVGATHRGGNPSVRIIPTDAEQVAIYDFGTRLPSSPRILVLKLDHLGDFIIGIPSLQQIRDPNSGGLLESSGGGSKWSRE
jgi:hypothetical protein